MLNKTRKSPTNFQQMFTSSHLSFSFIQIPPVGYLEEINRPFFLETKTLNTNDKTIILHRCLFRAINSMWDHSPYFTNYTSGDLLGGHSFILSSSWYRHHYIPWHFCLDLMKFLQSQCDVYMIFTIFVSCSFFLCAMLQLAQRSGKPRRANLDPGNRGGPRWVPKQPVRSIRAQNSFIRPYFLSGV